MIAVLGSGPAGVACASALLARGREVALLDAGVELEAFRRARVEVMARSRPEDWPRDFVDEMRRETPIELGGVPLKTVYGSAYPFEHVEELVPFENRGAALRPTLARGGFSAVWGAAVLPYAAHDVADWPVPAGDLAPHYRAACRLLPLAGRDDELARTWPLYTDELGELRASPQADALLADVGRARDRLARAGFTAGASRVAIRASDDAGGPGCVYCGLCLHGCPYGAIYNAESTLAGLRAKGLRYEPDFVAERLVERGDGVEILGRSRAGGARRFDAERVYVGCGVVSTTRLLLASLDAYDRPVRLADSQYFLVPWLRLRGVPDPASQPAHTLSQAFVELRDPDVSERTVHMQVYTYNDLYRRWLERALGRAYAPLRRPVGALLSRLLLIQGFLHSDDSPGITATLRRDGAGARLSLEAQPRADAARRVKRVVAKLARHARDFRALPARPLLQVAPPGRSFHAGGSFPMRASPGELECDVLARPTGFSRVHVIDASAFPSVPATTITLSVMAHAHRIGSASAGEGAS